MNDEIVIIGVTMVTPVGLDASQTCSSVRSGIARFEELPWENKNFDPVIMASVPDNCFPRLIQEIDNDILLTDQERRIIQLIAIAQSEFFDVELREKIPLFLGIPKKNSKVPLNLNNFLKYITMQMDLAINLEQSKIFAKGRASGLIAIHDACKVLKSGLTDFILVGGCDSYKDIDILAELDDESRLKSETSLDSFIPGEGVGFVLLTTEKKAKAKRFNILGKLKSTAIGYEEGNMYSKTPYRGDGLSHTFQTLFKNISQTEKIKTIYSSMNGESYWAKELSVSYIRNQDNISENFVTEHPADCYGDIGAASGPVMIGLAITGVQKKYIQGPALIYASSDHGERGTVIIDID